MIAILRIRSDLIMEAEELIGRERGKGIEGVEVNETQEGKVKVTEVKVTTVAGQKKTGKAMGKYFTIDLSGLYMEELGEASPVLAKLLKELIGPDDKKVLIVGLGNKDITPDALGPKVVDKLVITRHIKNYMGDKIDKNLASVAGTAPGVLGTTGIETEEIVEGIVQRIKPDVVIAIDALASRSLKRVNNTIQLADTGISPGSGVGNKRKGLTIGSLGVKVIAIGVPTVINAAVIADETISLLKREAENVNKNKNHMGLLSTLNDEDRYKMVSSVLDPYEYELIVTPKDIDVNITEVSRVIADGLNICFDVDDLQLS